MNDDVDRIGKDFDDEVSKLAQNPHIEICKWRKANRNTKHHNTEQLLSERDFGTYVLDMKPVLNNIILTKLRKICKSF